VVPIAFFNEVTPISFSPATLSTVLFLKNALLNIGASELEVKARLETIDELLLALLCLADGGAPSPMLLVVEIEATDTALVDNDLEERAATLALM